MPLGDGSETHIEKKCTGRNVSTLSLLKGKNLNIFSALKYFFSIEWK